MGKISRARPLLGTMVVAWAEGDVKRARAGVAAALEEIGSVERRMSFFDPASDVSRLNGGAHRRAMRAHPHTIHVLRAAERLSVLSGGVFDVTVGGVLGRAGFLPTNGRRPPAGGHFSDVRVGPDGRVRFLRPLWIDLGGIAKGFAVDRALAALRRSGVARGGINAGGDLAFFSDRREPLWCRHPSRPDRWMALGERTSGAVATSAPAFHARRGLPGAPYVHRGKTLNVRSGVTVFARRALWADALTKVALLSRERLEPMAKSFQAEVIYWEEN